MCLFNLLFKKSIKRRIITVETKENFFERDQYNKIWEAHKVRNNLVHESGYEPPYFVVIKAVQDLKEGLDKVGVRV